MTTLKYLTGYAEPTTSNVLKLINNAKLGEYLLSKYPVVHGVKTDAALYDYVVALKNEYLRQSRPLSKVVYDDKINVIKQALGLHTFISRVQGSKLKAKHEIRVAAVFKQAPLEFLRMIAVHELAHLKEKQHNKAFYKLCVYMEPDYQQLEFDMRLYLTYVEMFGKLY